MNCLSSEAHLRKPRPAEYIWLPLVVPERCYRCLHSYYAFTIFALPVAFGEWVADLFRSNGAD